MNFVLQPWQLLIALLAFPSAGEWARPTGSPPGAACRRPRTLVRIGRNKGNPHLG